MPESQNGAPFPSVEETLQHPAYPGTIWALEPHRKGRCAAALGRGGPVHISWEIHGEGPIKLVLVMSLAGVMASWQRQTKYFGHDRADKYSVLILDNRGMGESDKPLWRKNSSSDMARDLLDVLDEVGWTAEREVHLCGTSLGGMIAQELACIAPTRLASLTLVATAAALDRTETLGRAGMLVPKSLEETLEGTAKAVFGMDWLQAPDDAQLPSRQTSRCGSPPGTADGEYIRFDCNFQRFQAQELTKRLSPSWSVPAFLLQMLASALHHKSDTQLKAMADRVGRERITVMHGTADNMIKVRYGQNLIQILQPIRGIILDGVGHAIVQERAEWFNAEFEARITASEQGNGRM